MERGGVVEVQLVTLTEICKNTLYQKRMEATKKLISQRNQIHICNLETL